MSRPFCRTLFASVVVLAACAPARPATPSPRASLADFRLVEAAMRPADTLSVGIDGPATVRAVGSARYAATVRNGRTTTTRYYYWWFVASCARGSGCSPTSYQALAEGEGRDTVTVSFGLVHAEKDLVVQVAEIDGRGRTGSSTEFVIEGPARRTLGGGAGRLRRHGVRLVRRHLLPAHRDLHGFPDDAEVEAAVPPRLLRQPDLLAAGALSAAR